MWQWFGSEGESGFKVYQETVGIITRAPKQHEQVIRDIHHAGGGGYIAQRSKGRCHMRKGQEQCGKDPG